MEKGLPAILVDAGNFASTGEQKQVFEPNERTNFMWDMMSRLGYDAVTPGDLELKLGMADMKAMFARHPEIQVVCANLMDESGKMVFPTHTFIEKDGVTFGVTGVTGESYYKFNVTRGKQTKDEFTFRDTQETLAEMVPKLREKSDIVVVLMHEGPGDAQRILKEIEGIDVVVVGHNPGYMFNPDRVGNTLVLRAGNQGKYFTVLNLTLDDNGKILDYNGEGKPLGDAVAKEPSIETMVKEWETEFDGRMEADKRKKAAEKAQLQGTEKYVGAEMCARCHVDQYARWVETPHAKAYQTLQASHQETDADCLACHTVGFGEPSGYSVELLSDAKGEKYKGTDDQHLRNVGCESCHGMGTFHGTANLVKVPSAETCTSCHTPDQDEDFNYQEALAKVH